MSGSVELSIITVVLNNLAGLRRTAASLTDVKCHYEWIVIDAGSTDGTVAWLKQQDRAGLRWLSEPDNGMCDGMNKGWRLASGKWVFFLNGGDYMVNNLNHLLCVQAETDMITGRVNICFPDGQPTSVVFPKQHWRREDFIKRFTIAHQATFLRHDLLERFGPYDLNYPITADFEYWVRLQSNNASIEFVDDIIAGFILGGRSTQRDNFLRIEAERRNVLRKYGYITRLQSVAMAIKFWCVFHIKSLLLFFVPVSVADYLRGFRPTLK